MKRSKLIRQIVHVLENFPTTRDNDKSLMTMFYQTFFPEEFSGGWLKPDALLRMTSADDIVRLRAIIQNEKGLYLPKSAEVRKRRRQNEKAWEKWLHICRNKAIISQILNG